MIGLLYAMDESSARFQRLQENFQNKMTKVYLLFYGHVLQYFVWLNLLLQPDEPIIGILHVLVNCTSTRKITIIVIVQIWMKKFVQLTMSKFILVKDLRCVKLVDVNYHDWEGQLNGTYLLKWYYWHVYCAVCVFVCRFKVTSRCNHSPES